MGELDKLLSPFVRLAQKVSPSQASIMSVRKSNNIFTFYSPSGGSGVTVTAANITQLLAEKNKSVALVDFDLYYPSQFRFWIDTSREDIFRASVIQKLNSPMFSMEKVVHPTKNKLVSLFTALPDEQIYRMCNINLEGTKAFIRELASQYNYVIIDCKPPLNNETTIAAIELSRETFFMVKPTCGDLERVQKDILTLFNYSFDISPNVVQTMIKTTKYTEADLKDYKLKLLFNIPYSARVEAVSNNYNIVSKGDPIPNKDTSAYIKVCTEFTDYILNLD